MASFTCPDGHDSTAGDYCDVCGAPIGPSPSTSPSPPPPGSVPPPMPTSPSPSPPGSLSLPAVADQTCPNCHAPNVAGALFCENCGYDFTTGQLPRPLDPPTPATPASLMVPASATGSGDAVKPWVVEIWVDADWYSGQDVPEACPSPGMPTVIVLHQRSALVGRRSVSRGITPEIEISGDTGVSRRHANLSSDGQRWWAEDLASANGTYVGAAGMPLPEIPIPPGQRVELGEDGRVYLGGWTRLVVREATPGDLIVPNGS